MNHLARRTTAPRAVMPLEDLSSWWEREASSPPRSQRYTPSMGLAGVGRLAKTHRLANIHPMGSLAQEATSTESLTLHSISSRSCSQPAGLFYKDQPVRKIRHWWLQLLCGSSRVSPWITLRSQGHSATKIHSLSFVPQLVFLLQASRLIVPGSASRIQRK